MIVSPITARKCTRPAGGASSSSLSRVARQAVKALAPAKQRDRRRDEADDQRHGVNGTFQPGPCVLSGQRASASAKPATCCTAHANGAPNTPTQASAGAPLHPGDTCVATISTPTAAIAYQ